MLRASISGPLLAALAIAVAPMARADGGTVSGKVEVTPAKYLPDTVVYLKAVPGAYAPRTHSMDQTGMKFVPRVLIVTQGDSVRFLNHDGVAHNVYSPDGDGYNLGSFKKDEERTQTFARVGVFSQLCSVHPEMLGYVFVGQNPYAAAVDARGHYTIPDVPAGAYEVAVWNPHLPGPTKTVTVRAGAPAVLDFEVHR